MAIKCPQCHRVLSRPGNARFCPTCGKSLAGLAVQVRETGTSLRSRVAALAHRQFNKGRFWSPRATDVGETAVRVYHNNRKTGRLVATITRADQVEKEPFMWKELCAGGEWEDMAVVVLQGEAFDAAVELATELQSVTNAAVTVVKKF
jgi:hypothetical protein